MFEAESYTNHLGQTLNPGDTVIYVGTSYKNTSVKIGVFSGVYKKPDRKYNSGTRKYEDVGLVVSALKITNIKDTRWKYDRDTKQGEDVEITRTACLPLKRAYKVDLSNQHVKETVDFIQKII